jgi:hypothetical protein
LINLFIVATFCYVTVAGGPECAQLLIGKVFRLPMIVPYDLCRITARGSAARRVCSVRPFERLPTKPELSTNSARN